MSFTDFLDAEKLIVGAAALLGILVLCGIAIQIHLARRSNGWLDHFPAPDHPKRLDQRFRDGGAV